jgi:hypothetical protein
MDESGEGAAPDAEAGGGGITSFLTSVRGVVSTFAALVLALSGLVAALNQAGVIGDDDSEAAMTTTTTKPKSIFPPAERPNGRAYFEGEAMFVHASRAARPFLHLADLGDAISDMSMRVRTEWVSGAPDYGFGLICRYANAANYYLLSVLSGGRYNIVRYREGKPISLTGGIQTGSGAAEGANDVHAKCTGDEPTSLTLTINGRALPSVRDPDGIESGIVGVRVGSSESVVTLRFENFVLTEL